MAKLPRYLWRSKTGLLFFRRSIPYDLRPHFPQTSGEIKRSLKTGSFREAVKRARAWAVKTDQLFDELMAKNDPDHELLRIDLITHIEFFPDGSKKSETVIDNPELEREIALQKLGVGSAANLPASPLISEVLAEYEKDMRPKRKPKTLRNTADDVTLFIELIGDKPIAAIKSKEIGDFQQMCLRLPVRGRAGNPAYRGIPNKQLVEMEIPGADRLKNSNINTILASVSTIFNWAIRKDEFPIEINPCRAVEKLPVPENNPAGKCFKPNELKLLFESDDYKRGFEKPSRYWCPLIALYTGARIGEVAQLYLDDIQPYDETGSIYYFDLNDFTEDKSIKTKKRRLVPVHPKLIELGLLRFVDELKAKGEERLFPDLKSHVDGYGGHMVTSFGEYQKKCGVKVKGRNTHGFRYTFQNALGRKRVSFETIGEIVGHVRKVKMSGHYMGMMDIELLFEAVKDLDYGLRHPPFYRDNE